MKTKFFAVLSCLFVLFFSFTAFAVDKITNVSIRIDN